MSDSSFSGIDPVFSHDDPALQPPPPRDPQVEGARRAHLRDHLGVGPVVLSEKASVGIELDVLVFPPTEDRPYVVLASDGMSDRPMANGTRLELLIGVPARWPGLDPLDRERIRDESAYWPVHLLKDVARIPSTYDTTVSWGHTIVNDGEALLPSETGFGGALIGPPYGLPPSIMRAQTAAGEVDYLAIFPVTQAEMDFKVALPGGGDALLRRLHAAGVNVVAAAGRDSVVSAPPYVVHLLLSQRLGHLGQALTHTVPNRAELLAQEEATDDQIPVTQTQSVWARLSEINILQSGWAEWADRRVDQPALLAAIEEHRSVLSLYPAESGGGDPLAAVISLATVIASQEPNVAAVWLPHQQHVTTAARFAADAAPSESQLFRIHDLETPDGPAVVTRGLAAIGGREVLYTEPGVARDALRERLGSALGKAVGNSSTAPPAGTAMRYGFPKYELVEGTHPLTGDEVLVMTPVTKEKRGLFRKRA